MFEKLLSRVGIGAPHIEMVLHDSEVIRGETLHGKIHIVGGRSAQEIHHIDVALQTAYHSAESRGHDRGHRREHTETLRLHRVCEHFRLSACESRTLIFDLIVPMLTPVSLDIAQVWLKTKLDVSWVIQDRDYEPIRVLPDTATRHLLEAATALGFEHTSGSGECLPIAQEGDVPFTQVFSLVPKGRLTCRLGKQVQSLDLLVRANNYDADIQLEVNRQGQPLAPWLPEGQRQAARRLRFRLRHGERFPEGALAERIAQMLKTA